MEGHVADVSKKPGVCIECKTGYNAGVWISGDQKKGAVSHYDCNRPVYAPEHVAITESK
jgi:hypothetical protein